MGEVILMFLIFGGNFFVIVVYVIDWCFCLGIYILFVSFVFFDLFVGGVLILLWIYGFVKGWKVSVCLIKFYIMFDIFSGIVFNFYLMVILFECFIVVLWLFYY